MAFSVEFSKCKHEMMYPTDGSNPRCKFCGASSEYVKRNRDITSTHVGAIFIVTTTKLGLVIKSNIPNGAEEFFPWNDLKPALFWPGNEE